MPATSQLLEGRKALCGADACKALSKIHLGPAGLTAERGGSPDRPEARRRPGDPRKRGSQPHPRAWQAEPRTPRLPATLQEMRFSPKTCPGFWGEGEGLCGCPWEAPVRRRWGDAPGTLTADMQGMSVLACATFTFLQNKRL